MVRVKLFRILQVSSIYGANIVAPVFTFGLPKLLEIVPGSSPVWSRMKLPSEVNGPPELYVIEPRVFRASVSPMLTRVMSMPAFIVCFPAVWLSASWTCHVLWALPWGNLLSTPMDGKLMSEPKLINGVFASGLAAVAGVMKNAKFMLV